MLYCVADNAYAVLTHVFGYNLMVIELFQNFTFNILFSGYGNQARRIETSGDGFSRILPGVP